MSAKDAGVDALIFLCSSGEINVGRVVMRPIAISKFFGRH